MYGPLAASSFLSDFAPTIHVCEIARKPEEHKPVDHCLILVSEIGATKDLHPGMHVNRALVYCTGAGKTRASTAQPARIIRQRHRADAKQPIEKERAKRNGSPTKNSRSGI